MTTQEWLEKLHTYLNGYKTETGFPMFDYWWDCSECPDTEEVFQSKLVVVLKDVGGTDQVQGMTSEQQEAVEALKAVAKECATLDWDMDDEDVCEFMSAAETAYLLAERAGL